MCIEYEFEVMQISSSYVILSLSKNLLSSMLIHRLFFEVKITEGFLFPGKANLSIKFNKEVK